MFHWLGGLLRRSSPTSAAGQGHLTFSGSISRSISRTGLLLKKQLWIWPIIAVVLLAIVGYGVRGAIEHTMTESLRSELETLLNVETAMLQKWLAIQESNAVTLANDPQVRKTIIELRSAEEQLASRSSGSGSGSARQVADVQAALAKELEPAMSSHGFAGYVIADKSLRIIAAFTPGLVGTTVPQYESFLTRVLLAGPTVSTPFPSAVMLKDKSGQLRSGIPTMFAAAPVLDENLAVVAVLALRIPPEQEFTEILQLGRRGQSGETYAVDKNGRMVSGSRFDDDLVLLGILPDQDDSQSILNLLVRDPGGNVAEGFRPKRRRSELPLTKAASAAIAGSPGIDLTGYRNYRGVPVVGGWQWLPKYDLGIITEINHEEAYRPLSILRWTFFSIFALLIASSAAIFAFTLVVARLQREAQKAAIEAKNLGQYRLEEKLGAGGMGVVYKGHHAMLRRPTAIKMLNVDKVNDASIARFEREVQVTCKLNNPNTVAIYDYGRTPEGVFYYAMEYLDGIDLQDLVEQYGAQPEGRVIRILKAVCSSLYEAHSHGLVHRDIKPANIMLNRRGGEPDVVKVLDFGLVRALDEAKVTRQTGGLAGTPLYMSPEAIQSPDSVDPRSDIYAVGAVGYFLITGKPVFDAASLVQLCQQHITSIPASPSEKLGRAISPQLESALLACLEKNRAKRPQTARDLAALLDRSPAADSWSLEEADAWWSRHERTKAAAAFPSRPLAPSPTPGGTLAATAPSTHADGNGAASDRAAVKTAAGGLDQTIETDPAPKDSL